MGDRTTAAPLRRAALLGLWALLIAAHVFLVGRFIRFDQVLDERPFYRIDWPLHALNAVAGAEALRASGHYWSYNPAFGAGFPQGLFDDPGNHASALAVLVLPVADPVVAFKLWALITFLAVPALLALAAALAGLQAPGIWLSAALGTLFWQADPMVSLFRWFGSFNFLSGAVVALAVCCAAGSWLDRGGRGRLAALALLLALSFTAHPLSPIIWAVPVGILGLFALAARRWTRLLGLALAVGTGLAANLYWILPVVRFADLKGSFSFIAVSTGAPLLEELWLGPGRGLRAALVLLALAGWLNGAWLKLPLRAALGCGAALMYVLAGLGGRVSLIDELEPARYVMAGPLLAVPLAADALLAPLRRGLRARDAATLLALLVALGPAAWRGPAQIVARDFLLLQVRSDKQPELDWLERELRTRLDPSRRLLFEEGWIGARAPFGGYVAPLLQRASGTEMVGLNYPAAPLAEASLSLVHGRFLGRQIPELSPQELNALLDLYNVGWVVTWTAPSVGALERAGARLLARNAHLSLWERSSRPTYFVTGRGQVRSSLNRLEVEVDEAGPVVLRYHYLRTLRAEPPVELRRVDLPPDPVGFIGFEAPSPGRFVIANRF